MLRWERNLSPATIGMIRGILWALTAAAVEIALGITTSVKAPPWMVPMVPSLAFALRTVEGLVDHAKAKDPLPANLQAVLGNLTQAVEGAVGKALGQAPMPPTPQLDVGQIAPVSVPPTVNVTVTGPPTPSAASTAGASTSIVPPPSA